MVAQHVGVFGQSVPALVGARLHTFSRFYERARQAGRTVGPVGTARHRLPTLVVQGGSDQFGTPSEFPPLPPTVQLVGIPGADHVFTVPGSTGVDRERTSALIVEYVERWLGNLL